MSDHALWDLFTLLAGIVGGLLIAAILLTA
jgi:hypothetical protein